MGNPDFNEAAFLETCDLSDYVNPVQETDKPTIYKSDEDGYKAAESMIYQHQMSLVGDYSRTLGMLYTIIMTTFVCLVLPAGIIWVMGAIGLLDKISAVWSQMP